MSEQHQYQIKFDNRSDQGRVKRVKDFLRGNLPEGVRIHANMRSREIEISSGEELNVQGVLARMSGHRHFEENYTLKYHPPEASLQGQLEKTLATGRG